MLKPLDLSVRAFYGRPALTPADMAAALQAAHKFCAIAGIRTNEQARHAYAAYRPWSLWGLVNLAATTAANRSSERRGSDAIPVLTFPCL